MKRFFWGWDWRFELPHWIVDVSVVPANFMVGAGFGPNDCVIHIAFLTICIERWDP